FNNVGIVLSSNDNRINEMNNILFTPRLVSLVGLCLSSPIINFNVFNILFGSTSTVSNAIFEKGLFLRELINQLLIFFSKSIYFFIKSYFSVVSLFPRYFLAHLYQFHILLTDYLEVIYGSCACLFQHHELH